MHRYAARVFLVFTVIYQQYIIGNNQYTRYSFLSSALHVHNVSIFGHFIEYIAFRYMYVREVKYIQVAASWYNVTHAIIDRNNSLWKMCVVFVVVVSFLFSSSPLNKWIDCRHFFCLLFWSSFIWQTNVCVCISSHISNIFIIFICSFLDASHV